MVTIVRDYVSKVCSVENCGRQKRGRGLCSKHLQSQPCGQRVEDKVEWAKQLLSIYQPDSLHYVSPIYGAAAA